MIFLINGSGIFTKKSPTFSEIINPFDTKYSTIALRHVRTTVDVVGF